ncbi:MAG: hypothetical protein HY883_04770 [Deltaproteobacteria bacterium]|nr:hypothetical protein [Deltaproteobacteria bacterium]
MAIDWTSVKAGYEEKNLSFKELSGTCGCSPETIRKRAGKEGWKAPPLIKKGKRKKGPENLLDEHRRLWGRVKRKLSDGLKKSDEKELKLAKIAGDTLLDIVKGEKEAWGITNDDAGAHPEEVLAITGQMERATVSSPAGAAVERDEEV